MQDLIPVLADYSIWSIMISSFMSQSWWSENAEIFPNFEERLPSRWCISINTGFNYTTEGLNRKFSFLREKTGYNTISPDPALESWKWNRQRFLWFCNLDSSRFSNSLLLHKYIYTDLSSIFDVSIFTFLLLLH